MHTCIHAYILFRAGRPSCDNSRGNMFHNYVCCIVYSPPALTLHCQCSTRRAPQEFSISLSQTNAYV